jgi:hypothetical protein
MPLNEALSTAFDLGWKVNCQRHEASTQLDLRPLPGREGSLRRFSRGYVVRCWIRMAYVGILLHLAEGSVLGRIALSQARGVLDEVGLKGFILVLLLTSA